MTTLDPFRAFRFRVEIDGTRQGGFQAVSGLERETRIEPYREGGNNFFEHQLAVMSTYPPLTLKRGLVDPTLWDWHQDVIEGRIERRTVAVVLLKQGSDDEAWRWVIAGAFPAKWTGADLDATTAAIATESVQLVHHGVTRL